ncbi:MAG: HNH endonuclease [Azospirillum sp.]|nr:HNH endonuclease [Azospirillum sp.]
MPYAAPRHCPKPGHAPFTGPRCPVCAQAGKAAADARRPDAKARGYGADWKKLRAELMPEGTSCRLCGYEASHLDHILPKARGGTDDPSNLQPLCHRCHSTKTDSEDGGFGNRKMRRG